MANAKLIHDYLDGERVPAPEEEALFNSLASDDELRKEFQRQVKLHTIAQRDMNSITPPAAVTDKVFAGLGFAVPSELSVATNAGFFAGSWNFIKRNSVLLLLLLLGVSVAGSGYFYFQNNHLKNELNGTKSELLTAKNELNVQKIEQANQNSIPVSESYAVDMQNSLSSNQNGNANGNNYNLVSNSSNGNSSNNSVINISGDNNISNTDKFENNDKKAEQIFTIIDIAAVNNQFYANEFRNGNNNVNYNEYISNRFIETQPSFYSEYGNVDNTKWRLVIRRISPMQYAGDEISSGQNFALNNVGFSLLRKLDDNHSIGVEFGWEQFGQSFVTSNDNISFTQTQNPMLFFAGATYSFTPVNWIIPYELYPFANLSAAATGHGPLFRAQAGMNWRVSGNFNLIFGYEYGTLFYNVDNVIYNSNKSGLILGTRIKF